MFRGGGEISFYLDKWCKYQNCNRKKRDHYLGKPCLVEGGGGGAAI